MSTQAVSRSLPPPLPARPPAGTVVQMPPPPQRSLSNVSATSSSPSPSSSRRSSASTVSYPTIHAEPAVRITSAPSIAQRDPELGSAPAEHHHRSSHSYSRHHHQLSAEDRELARALQREEESRLSEAAIRWGLTQQFARAANRPVEDVDLSSLTLAEAQQAIEIQLTIRQQQKKRSVMAALRARFSSRKRGLSAAASSPSAASAQHLSPVARAEQRSSSPSPSPPSPYRDVDSMSYEELLALGEAIGDVKGKGLTEAEIDRLPTAVFHRQRKEGEAEQEPEQEAEAQQQQPVAVSPALAAASAAEAAAVQEKQRKRRWFFSRQAKAGGREEAAVAATTAALKGKEEQKAQSGSQQRQQPVSACALSPAASGCAEARWRDTCSICLEAFRDGDLLRFLPCLHRMHCDELDQWLLVNASCPICKEKPTLH